MSSSSWRALEFSQESFDPDLFALCRDVPLLDHVLCKLEELHDPILDEDRVLRNHQRDLALQGWFGLRLPQAGATLRADRAVMLEDKMTFFGVQGRADMFLAAARVGFTHPLCSVVLPRQRTVVNVRGQHWNVGAAAAERAAALFAAAGEMPDSPTPVLVTGDANFAHHLWNQLGALEALLAHRDHMTVLATHQPIAPLAEIFADYPGLTVTATPTRELPGLGPHRALPFAAGGMIVSRSVRDRVRRVAERRAARGVRDFLARVQAQSLNLIWLSIRLRDRTATNLLDALLALGESLLSDGKFALVIDGFSRPNDYAGNRDYDRAMVERSVAQEQAMAHALVAYLAGRAGAAVAERIFMGVGCDLLDSIHLAAHCRGYFAHHGTLQHKLGYFTTVPGLVHSNPAVIATDRAGTHLHVIEDPGIVEYIDGSLVADMPAPGGAAMQTNNNYRFTNIPAVVAMFRNFLARQGVR